ncbi:hypothetical protein B0H19DRAFT_972898, partial [Mycena capillaripes]
GGSVLTCFSLLMLSLCNPEQFYQIFLAQGLGTGIGAGTMFVPRVAVVSYYIQKRCARYGHCYASTGSAFGAVIHPIMLNNTLRSHLGFGDAIRASAGLVSGLLLIACLSMRPRLPPSRTPPFWTSLRRFRHDRAYMLATIGSVNPSRT